VSRPKLLDLFCGAGGCSVGYHRAGFDVTGVDIESHPDYPFTLIVADAMEVLGDAELLDGFDVVHASPPCPRYSAARTIGSYDPEDKPDLVAPVREALSGRVWVMENVPGAPMPNAVTYCGWGVGLKHIRRHRLFESSAFLLSPGCACPNGDSISVFGHSGEDRRKATIAAGGGKGTHIPIAEVRELMGVPWMRNRDDVSDAIPPAYTEHIGAQLIAHLEEAAA
jgi:DNA (cytosine-5)-methyltransferase 1